jgi:hypothetical protein
LKYSQPSSVFLSSSSLTRYAVGDIVSDRKCTWGTTVFVRPNSNNIGGLADNIAIFQPGAYAFAGMKSKGPHVRRVFDEFIDRELNSGDFRGALDIVDRFDIPHGGIICPKRPRIFQKDILQDLAELVVNWLVLTLEQSCANV